MTLVKQLKPVLEECQDRASFRHPSNTASREFAIAAHSLEDAIMRINLGFAKLDGNQEFADVEATKDRR